MFDCTGKDESVLPVPPLRGCPCTTKLICEHWQQHLPGKVFKSCDVKSLQHSSPEWCACLSTCPPFDAVRTAPFAEDPQMQTAVVALEAEKQQHSRRRRFGGSKPAQSRQWPRPRM